jgi:HD-like signal output (HDOD) protein
MELRDLLENEAVSELVSQIETLPSLPNLYMEIIEKLNQEDTALSDIAAIIKKDVSMSAEILKLVNSSFFGFFNKISNIEQAVSLLGLNMIKTLVLSIKVFEQFPRQDQISISIKELWDHSFLVGILTGKIVYDFTKDRELQESAFTIGLLHDIGMITLASQLPQKYKRAYDHAYINQLKISEGEYKFLGSSHAEVGAYLVGLWGFSDEVTTAIANHHLNHSKDEEIEFLSLATHCADIYVQKLRNTNQGLPLEKIHDLALKDRRYVENHERWFDICSDFYQKGTNE